MKIEKVLLVDDDDNIRLTTAMVLEDQWQVVLASSGPEALEAISKERPDLILLDVMMPGMDGPSVLQRLKELSGCENIPVIFITAKVQTHEVPNYLEIGAVGIIAKPFDPATLISDICRILSQEH